MVDYHGSLQFRLPHFANTHAAVLQPLTAGQRLGWFHAALCGLLVENQFSLSFLFHNVIIGTRFITSILFSHCCSNLFSLLSSQDTVMLNSQTMQLVAKVVLTTFAILNAATLLGWVWASNSKLEKQRGINT